MKNTQSFNTPKGLEDVKKNFEACQKAVKQGDHKAAAKYYDAAFQATYLFPPCNVVSSLRNDFTNYQFKNIPGDLKVINDSRDKIRY
ncbi:hypothetical protein [Acetilactobacillus jinshanensis]|uniref:Uncharacterized protein n=1 Tax=Acetilactobacillus jinshanensis TaxID=1720083 RepID=A0A4P6ZM77_9LACO|nr:hypothetical protein [Acetilactobacillus jinshanensis]QBP18340.1 hypothetical protein ELX58_04140 [Acetilactobacillus jinshanensis]URL61205.1 hypothetical protein HGK75_04205 [uncultured bacterium]